MQETTSREKILKKVRNALMSKLENPYQDTASDEGIYATLEESLDINFAQEFTKASGKFIYCESEQEFLDHMSALIRDNEWDKIFCKEEDLLNKITASSDIFEQNADELVNCKVALSTCESLIARLGSILVSSKQFGGRRINAFPEVHMVFAYTSQLVPDLKDGLKHIKNKYAHQPPSMITLIAGPSRTADIEKTLVMGAHGPKELYLFFIDDSTK